MIGGNYCQTAVPADLLPGDLQQLTARELNVLWRLFQAIGRTWRDSSFDSVNIHSGWVEFIHAKTTVAPSYTGEYSNAVSCVGELVEMYGEAQALEKLFLESGVDSQAPPVTRLAHAKVYVVDEFIRVQVSQEGFKSWQGHNYKGFVGGSRFNRKPRARVAEGEKE
jgi:hypothetical protein